jgi:hypothetical protein
MSYNVTNIVRSQAPGAQQLTLLSVPEAESNSTESHSSEARLKSSAVHPRFQLSATARARGLEHVAEIRRQLAASQAAREAAPSRKLPRRNQAA